MRVEANKPLTVQLPDRQFQLDPGMPTTLPDDVARKLLTKAPGLVRVVEQTGEDSTLWAGRLVKWNSPRFGARTGRVLTRGEGGWMITLTAEGGLTWVHEVLHA